MTHECMEEQEDTGKKVGLSLEQQLKGYIKETNDAFLSKITTNIQPVEKTVTTKLYPRAVALPGSILNNSHTLKMKTLLVGQIARFCAIFCVDEIVIFDDKDVGYGWVESNDQNCSLMKKLLEFIVIPQYLRTSFFGKDNDLSSTSLLRPLATPHHMRADEHSRYRTGVTLDKVNANGFTFANCGLDRDILLDRKLKPNLCVTVQLKTESSISGVVVSPNQPRKEGIYWGYSVRVVDDISSVFYDQFGSRYSTIIGTSDKGYNLECVDMKVDPKGSMMIVFGGVKGLEFAFANSRSFQEKSFENLFDYYVNCCPGQGCRTIRTEEALPIVLTSLQTKFNF